MTVYKKSLTIGETAQVGTVLQSFSCEIIRYYSRTFSFRTVFPDKNQNEQVYCWLVWCSMMFEATTCPKTKKETRIALASFLFFNTC